MTNGRLLRLPLVPRHDPSRDGNPFAWIVATAQKVREQHSQLQRDHRAKVQRELEDE